MAGIGPQAVYSWLFSFRLGLGAASTGQPVRLKRAGVQAAV